MIRFDKLSASGPKKNQTFSFMVSLSNHERKRFQMYLFEYKNAVIEDGEGWMKMLVDRNQTPHTYNEDTANEIFQNIVARHFQLLQTLARKLGTIQDER